MTIVRAHRVGMSPDPVGTDSGAMLAVARAATEHEGQKGPHVLHPGKLGGPFRLRLRLRYRDRVRWCVRYGRGDGLEVDRRELVVKGGQGDLEHSVLGDETVLDPLLGPWG